jgi:glycosyltransferase involved in cell wall biosynthesis
MHLMIFDPHERGHYLAYVRYLLAGAKDADRVTLVLRQGVIDSEPFQQQLASTVNNVEVDAAIGPESFHDGQQLHRDFWAAVQRHGPDHVWVPSGDLLARHCNIAQIAQRRRVKRHMEAECGLIEIRFHHPPRRWRGHLRHTLDRLVIGAGTWSRLHTIDPTLFNWARARGGRLGRSLHLVPDPIDQVAGADKLAARRSLGIPEHGRYVVSAGVHAVPRKGSELLLGAFVRAGLGRDDRLLLAGPLGDRLKHLLGSDYASQYRSGNIVTLDRYLDHHDLMTALAAADVVCTPYFDHLGSSAIVLQAAQAGRPVIAPKQGWFAEMIPRFQLGDIGNILEPEGLASAIRSGIERAHDFRLSHAAHRLLEYSDSRNFARLWAARLRQRKGLPIDEQTRRWDWVVAAVDAAA